MTPREIKGHLYFTERHLKRQEKRLLALHTAAARGDPKDIKKHLNKKDDP